MLFHTAIVSALALGDQGEQGNESVPTKPVVFIGSSVIRVATAPFFSINGSANATVEISHGGPARNTAENFARIGVPQKIQMLTTVGEDTFGQALVSELAAVGIDCSAILRLDTIDTPTEVIMGVEASQLKTLLGPQGAPEVKKADEAEDMVVNGSEGPVVVGRAAADAGRRITAAYLQEHEGILEGAATIYTDTTIAPEALRHLASKYGGKLFVYLSGGGAGLLRPRGRGAIGYIMLTVGDLVRLQALAKHDADIQSLLGDGKVVPGGRRVPYFQHLTENRDSLVALLGAVHQAFGADNVLIALSSQYILSSFGRATLVTLTEHSCTGKCIVSEEGSLEAFAAGFLAGLETHHRIDDRLESAAFAMISSLKSGTSVNKALNPKMLRQMASTSFVSYKVVYDAHGEDSIDGNIVTNKAEL